MAYIDKELFKQDIKMRYCNNCARPNEIKCRACHVDDMLGEIEDAPTADVVEVREARWKGAGVGDYYCSLCQETVGGNNFRFCPYCGAKMDGGKTE